MRLDPENNTYSVEERVEYNVDRGQLEVFVNGELKQITKVRAALENDLLLQALIYELEQRGYTVIRP